MNMKTPYGEVYLCKLCGAAYSEQRLAEECEKHHITIDKLKSAIETTKKVQSNMIKNKDCYHSESLEAVGISIAAMERLIPKRPNCWTDDGWCCPVCNSPIDSINPVECYCRCCGQAIGNSEG